MAKSRLTTEPEIDWSRFDAIRHERTLDRMAGRPGPEWVTMPEYARRFGLSQSAARKRLAKAHLYDCHRSGALQNSPVYYRAKPVHNS